MIDWLINAAVCCVAGRIKLSRMVSSETGDHLHCIQPSHPGPLNLAIRQWADKMSTGIGQAYD